MFYKPLFADDRRYASLVLIMQFISKEDLDCCEYCSTKCAISEAFARLYVVHIHNILCVLADFADELKKARQFGSMTTFGRGLPRGGEMSAVKSLQRQEDILRALYKRDPVVSVLDITSYS